eukprot:5845864-Prymnesium_polylepis.1
MPPPHHAASGSAPAVVRHGAASSRWRALAIALLLESVAGMMYAFSVCAMGSNSAHARCNSCSRALVLKQRSACAHAAQAAVGLCSRCHVIAPCQLYSDTLRLHFNLTQQETDMIGTVGNWGGNFGLHIGYFYGWFGPRATVLLAGCLGVPAWLM